MAVGTHISVEEYLNTSYEPDVEYVDGVLVERNVGKWSHGLTQMNIGFALKMKYPGIYVIAELRSRTRPTRFRLPDIAVLLAESPTEVLLEAAFIAIEILSDEDRMSRVTERLKEFEEIGTRYIWVVDPQTRALFTFLNGQLEKVEGDVLATDNPRIELTRAEIFKDLRPLS